MNYHCTQVEEEDKIKEEKDKEGKVKDKTIGGKEQERMMVAQLLIGLNDSTTTVERKGIVRMIAHCTRMNKINCTVMTAK